MYSLHIQLRRSNRNLPKIDIKLNSDGLSLKWGHGPDPLNFPLVNFSQFFLIHPWFWWDPLTIQRTHRFKRWRWRGSMDTLQFHTCETAGDPIPIFSPSFYIIQCIFYIFLIVIIIKLIFNYYLKPKKKRICV